MTRACLQIGVDPGDLTAPHAVDDFITTSLNRSSDDWDGLTVPDHLRDLAELTWTTANRLVEAPYDADAMAELDRLQAVYADLYTSAAAIASDDTTAQVLAVRTELTERLATKNERLEKLRIELDTRMEHKKKKIKELRAEVRELRAATKGPGA